MKRVKSKSLILNLFKGCFGEDEDFLRSRWLFKIVATYFLDRFKNFLSTMHFSSKSTSSQLLSRLRFWGSGGFLMITETFWSQWRFLIFINQDRGNLFKKQDQDFHLFFKSGSLSKIKILGLVDLSKITIFWSRSLLRFFVKGFSLSDPLNFRRDFFSLFKARSHQNQEKINHNPSNPHSHSFTKLLYNPIYVPL